MATQIKADRLLLIKALESEQKKMVNDYKRAMERYRKSEAEYKDLLAAALEKAAERVRKGYVPKNTDRVHRNGSSYDVAVFPDLPPVPQKPDKPRATCDLERMIATLKLSKQETIALNETSVYVKFACEL